MAKTRLTEGLLRRAGVGVFFRPGQLAPLGISYDRLRGLVADGTVERVAHGLYRFADAEPTENYTLAAVSARVPRSIVCLLSALKVHGIGTQLPREVWIAIEHGSKPPRLPEFRLRIITFSGAAWSYGIEDTEFEGVPARITSPARTVLDCFRFERLVGREAAMEALREALGDKRVTVDALCRAEEALPSRSFRSALEALPQ